jgi:hypothetical protein
LTGLGEALLFAVDLLTEGSLPQAIVTAKIKIIR